MLVCSLGSGSSGNAMLIRSAAQRSILIDCGVQYPRLCRNLARLGLAPGDIDAVYLSHEHTDHTQAARPLREFWDVPIIASRALVSEAAWLRDAITDVYEEDCTRSVGDLTVVPRRVSHDAAATFGFTVCADGCTAAIFTDLGTATDGVRAAIGDADLTVIEANYDRDMLEQGTYPWYLKSRIKGRGGHLSNEDCADLLIRSFAEDRPRDVWLAHLSANNNTPERAVESVSAALTAAGISRACISALPRYANGPVWRMIRHEQLTLFG